MFKIFVVIYIYIKKIYLYFIVYNFKKNYFMVCKNIRIMEVLIMVYSFEGSFNKYLKIFSKKRSLLIYYLK